MLKIRWIVLLLVAGAAFVGLKPRLTTLYHTENVGRQTAPESRDDITALTQDDRVANYLRQHRQLPPYYLTRRAARQQGWNPGHGDLCDVLPGKAIGGDHFANCERRLPERHGRQWYEADVNYQCGYRNTDRLLYSNDGLIYLTRDHYRTMTRIP